MIDTKKIVLLLALTNGQGLYALISRSSVHIEAVPTEMAYLFMGMQSEVGKMAKDGSIGLSRSMLANRVKKSSNYLITLFENKLDPSSKENINFGSLRSFLDHGLASRIKEVKELNALGITAGQFKTAEAVAAPPAPIGAPAPPPPPMPGVGELAPRDTAKEIEEAVARARKERGESPPPPRAKTPEGPASFQPPSAAELQKLRSGFKHVDLP